jgi:hypothetical protein
MGFFRFRRSFGLIPGVRLNLGKKSASLSFGVRGLRYTVGTAGRRMTAGIPGTGLAYTKVVRSRSGGRASLPPRSGIELGREMLENARGRYTDEAIALVRMSLECAQEGRAPELADLARFGLTPDQFVVHQSEARELMQMIGGGGDLVAAVQDSPVLTAPARRPGARLIILLAVLVFFGWLALREPATRPPASVASPAPPLQVTLPAQPQVVAPAAPPPAAPPQRFEAFDPWSGIARPAPSVPLPRPRPKAQ